MTPLGAFCYFPTREIILRIQLSLELLCRLPNGQCLLYTAAFETALAAVWTQLGLVST